MDIKDFDVEMWLNIYENDCRFNLSDTFPHGMTAGKLLDMTGDRTAITDEIMGLELNYGEITGSERLRKAVSGLYKSIPPECVTAAHGAIGANSLALMSLIRPGDRVITFTPGYQQLSSLPESLGAEVTILPLYEEKGWLPDIDELRAAVTDDTRLICFNNPNNPTGAVMPLEMMKEAAAIAQEHGALVFCDEAYRGLSHTGQSFSPSFADICSDAIVTGGVSKNFALAGLRLGWVAGPREIIDDINRHRDYHVISIGRIDELLAAIAIENSENVLSRNLAMIKENLSIIDKWVSEEPLIEYVKPGAATTCFIKYGFDIPSTELCLRLREEAGVLFVPGKAFDCEYHFRLGYGNTPDVIAAGLKAFSDWMRKNLS